MGAEEERVLEHVTDQTTKDIKKIILLSDGTGNSRAKFWKSNVWRLYKALDLDPNSSQIAFYDDGVGTSPNKLLAVLGGVFGFGLARNVRELYSFLCRTYSDGDEIYIFGFSRGAFTARVLAGFICSQGIVKYTGDGKELGKSVYCAYKAFRRAAFGKALLQRPIERVSDVLDRLTCGKYRQYNPKDNARYRESSSADCTDSLIHFMGLWDTVDAYGGPIDELTNAFNSVFWSLRAADRDISCRVQRVCHALALDEQRQSFEPMIINEKNTKLTKNVCEERITQVWFNGVHSDVGGGYPDNGLSLVTLKWMMEQCSNNSNACCLNFIKSEKDSLFAGADHTARLNDSRSGVGVFYRYDPRDLEKLCNDQRYGWLDAFKRMFQSCEPQQDTFGVDLPKIHHTVFDRICSKSSEFVPFNVPSKYAVVSKNGDIHSAFASDPMKDSDVKAKDAAQDTSEDKEQGSRFETPLQARERGKDQKVLWNKVWIGKNLYFITALMIVVFLTVPFLNLDPNKIAKLEQGVTAGLGTWTKVLENIPGTVKQIMSVIPGSGYLDPVFAFYSGAPIFFLAFLIALGTLLRLGSCQRKALYNQMALLWASLRCPGTTVSFSPVRWRRTVARWHFSKGYGCVKSLKRFFAEALAILAFLYIGMAIVSRLFLIGTDAFGGICNPTHEEYLETLSSEPKAIEFLPTNPCLATKLKLLKDQTYRIVLETKVASFDQRLKLTMRPAAVSNSDTLDSKLETIKQQYFWSDATILSDLTGWQESPWYMPLAIPFRRHLFVDWYQPIVRIGHKWFFRKSLISQQTKPECIHAKVGFNSKPGSDPVDLILTQRVESTLVALKEGELFLYLNDGVLLNPKWVSRFYENNLGVARVTIQKVVNNRLNMPEAGECGVN